MGHLLGLASVMALWICPGERGCGSLGWGRSSLGKMSEFSMHELIMLACEVGSSSPWGRKSRGQAPAGALGL